MYIMALINLEFRWCNFTSMNILEDTASTYKLHNDAQYKGSIKTNSKSLGGKRGEAFSFLFDFLLYVITIDIVRP